MNNYTTNDTKNGKLEPDTTSFKQAFLEAKEWVYYLISKWLIISLFGVFGGILGYFYNSYVQPAYIATSTFVLEDGDGSVGLGQYAGIASMVGIDIGGGGGLFQGDNIIELYKSRTMIQEALLKPIEINGKNQLLVDRYIEFNNLRDDWNKDLKLKSLNFDLKANAPLSRLQDSILGMIVKRINKKHLFISKPDKKLSLLKVDVISKDELFSKAFNDQIVENVNDFYIHKTDSVRAVMNGAIYSAAAISDATPNLNPTRQIQRTAPVQRSQYSAETNKAILSELVKNLELSRINLSKETPLIQLVDHPLYPLDSDKIGKIKGLLIGAFLSIGLVTAILLVLRLFAKLLE
jgi:hypothetical protein